MNEKLNLWIHRFENFWTRIEVGTQEHAAKILCLLCALATCAGWISSSWFLQDIREIDARMWEVERKGLERHAAMNSWMAEDLAGSLAMFELMREVELGKLEQDSNWDNMVRLRTQKLLSESEAKWLDRNR